MPLKVQKDIESTINLTPLIDIVFLLIIFFMVGTRFTELNEVEKNIPLQVPTVSQATALTSAPRKRVINILSDGQILLDDRQLSIVQLQDELTNARQQYQKLGVVVRGDEDARHGRIVEVMAACRAADISDLNVSVRLAAATGATVK